MKKLRKLPTTGQWVSVWTSNDLLWSATFRWHGGVLQEYDSTEGNWEVSSRPPPTKAAHYQAKVA